MTSTPAAESTRTLGALWFMALGFLVLAGGLRWRFWFLTRHFGDRLPGGAGVGEPWVTRTVFILGLLLLVAALVASLVVLAFD